jgi:hypothetical protein
VGVVLSIVGVVALVYAIIEAPLHGWTSHLTLGAFAGAVVVLIAFAVWELRIDHPMMNIGFFSNPRFTAASVSLTLVFFALLGSLFLLTQYLQFILGYTPFQAGVRVIPMAVALMVVSPLAGRLVERVGNRVLVGGGLAAAAGGLYYMSRITPADGYGRVLISLIVLGVGLALTMVPATESIMGSLPPAQAGIGSAMNDTTRQLGAALGVAVLGSLWASSFSSSILSHLSVLPPDVVAAAKSSVGEALKTGAQIGGPAGFQAVSVVKDAFIHAMDRALEIGSVVALGGAAVSALWLPSRARAQARLVDEVIEPEAVPVGGGTRGGGDRAVGDLALSPSSHDGRGQSVPGPSTQVAAAAETGDARLSLEPMYATVEAWVTDWFVPTFGDRLGAEDWCPRWWEHAEAVIRLESLWRPWEVLRLDPAMGMATWLRDYLQPQWEVLIDQFGPLRGCDHNVRNLSPSLQQTRPLPASFRH